MYIMRLRRVWPTRTVADVIITALPLSLSVADIMFPHDAVATSIIFIIHSIHGGASTTFWKCQNRCARRRWSQYTTSKTSGTEL